jgi:hypothetical protein
MTDTAGTRAPTRVLDVESDHTLALVVSRAWRDADYLERFVGRPREVLAEAGFEADPAVELRVLVDTPAVTHVAVTRQTTEVGDLARTLAPMFPVPADTQIRVVQSTDEIRYIVVPLAPEGLSAQIDAELGLVGTKPDDTAQVKTNVEVVAEVVEAAVEAHQVATEVEIVIVLT